MENKDTGGVEGGGRGVEGGGLVMIMHAVIIAVAVCFVDFWPEMKRLKRRGGG